MTTIDVLKAAADETRMRMLNLLVESEDLCGCEIEAVLGANQSNASRHLTRLRSAGLVDASKRGQWVHYAFRRSSPHAELIRRIVHTARGELERFHSDLARLKDYRDSPFTCETIWHWVELRDAPSAEPSQPSASPGPVV
ncbi:MAG: metalloregulator ArsR/SmtB family transcription factor [Spirochaetes bacterium]|jgi:ArsR family transcriptional regulator|nr:metalloregulator ArsR/SmtB family transcription factor [Spirochaetota bacterium]